MKVDEFFIFQLPDTHPSYPGRIEADLEYGPSARQGGQVIAGPFSTFVEARNDANERDLYAMCNRVFDGTASADDLERTEAEGYVLWEIDSDGYDSSPTQKYLELMDKFDPTPEENDND